MSADPLCDVMLEDDRWAALDLPALAERAARATLAHLGLAGDWEIALLACDDARIAELNAEFREKPKATNVLSWPSEERAPETPGATPALPEGPDPELGDIAIAYETCAREAVEQGKTLHDHVTHLVVHATLHLLGYDHETEADALFMEGAEREILAQMGLSDPYATA